MAIHRLIGPPGTGKTYSIAKNVHKAVERYGPRGVIVCSLTRNAAAEAAGRIPLPPGQIGTMHALIYRELGSPAIAETKIAGWNETHGSLQLESDKSSLDEPQRERFFAASDGMQLLGQMNTLRMRAIPPDHWPMQLQQFHAQWSDWKNQCGYLDFTDLLETALAELDTAPNNPRVLFFDETQDFGRLELSVIEQWSKRAVETILVGDPYQCLFSWRGSDPDVIFPVDSPDIRVLRQSKRVPRLVHEKAMQWIAGMPGYRDIEYYPTEHEGHIGRVGTYEEPETLLRLLEEPGELMVQTSCAYMLEPTIALLREHGIPYHNPKRLRAGNWNPLRTGRGIALHQRLMAFLRPWASVWEEHTAFWTAQDVLHWSAALRAAQVFKKGGKSRIEELAKQEHVHPNHVALWLKQWLTDDAQASMPSPGQASPAQAAAWWKERLLPKYATRADYFLRILARDVRGLLTRPRVIVGTIHSLKGSEADNVVVYPDISYAGHEEYEDVRTRAATYRQFYVALTRAKHGLYIGDPLKYAVDL